MDFCKVSVNPMHFYILMTFCFNVSNIFKESPTGGRSTANGIESKPEKITAKQPVAESDPRAEDAGT